MNIRSNQYTLDTMPSAKPETGRILYEIIHYGLRLWSMVSDDYLTAMAELDEFLESNYMPEKEFVRFVVGGSLACRIKKDSSTLYIKPYGELTYKPVNNLANYTKLHLHNQECSDMILDISGETVTFEYSDVSISDNHTDLMQTSRSMVSQITHSGCGVSRKYILTLNGSVIAELKLMTPDDDTNTIVCLYKNDTEWIQLTHSLEENYKNIIIHFVLYTYCEVYEKHRAEAQ